MAPSNVPERLAERKRLAPTIRRCSTGCVFHIYDAAQRRFQLTAKSDHASLIVRRIARSNAPRCKANSKHLEPAIRSCATAIIAYILIYTYHRPLDNNVNDKPKTINHNLVCLLIIMAALPLYGVSQAFASHPLPEFYPFDDENQSICYQMTLLDSVKINGQIEQSSLIKTEVEKARNHVSSKRP